MTKSKGIRERTGMSKTPIYGVWSAMRSRCGNPASPAFPRYGGRGIFVCDRWAKFSAFLDDMGLPKKGETLERRDNSKGYSPENCFWANRTTQGRNKRNNLILEIDDERMPLSAWTERFGAVSYATAHQRLKQGWGAKEAVSTPPVKCRRKYTVKNASVSYSTFRQRMRRGWAEKDALSLPVRRGPQ